MNDSITSLTRVGITNSNGEAKGFKYTRTEGYGFVDAKEIGNTSNTVQFPADPLITGTVHSSGGKTEVEFRNQRQLKLDILKVDVEKLNEAEPDPLPSGWRNIRMLTIAAVLINLGERADRRRRLKKKKILENSGSSALRLVITSLLRQHFLTDMCKRKVIQSSGW